MSERHEYETVVRWTGNRGSGTDEYDSYGREHLIEVVGKAPLRGSADPAFLGDPELLNPEELLVASLAQCHMLWYLGICASSGVVVTDYRDAARGTMTEERGGGGRFTEVVLRPVVTVRSESMRDRAEKLHEQAHRKCFIANSVNFPVRHEPGIRVVS
ncbi:Organic hydroperoxide reductase OsmC/OhrA [Actinopolyspora lacussalsi subsp. righensis]|uniref:Organic hydroperoxide reductase OsmC/OhrA n=1 Tax=Actinopolyspora righensis TaxID=995060 RepID=A0A1I6YS56_9ACTN|nr:OsmC family protein [Actinopolyspora righensis]SFT53243.1 Organic hydroperoxide reductase OsmC/OhrA [Actinopolyspora righensis]